MNNLINNRYKQKIPVTDFMSTLQSVQINPTEMCNRTCSFCPRNNPKVYKNRKLFIDENTSHIIGQQLNYFKFQGRVGFVGFGEPLLNNNLSNCVKIIKEECPSISWIEVNTNGDLLSRDIVKNLCNNGCTDLTVSMYDSDETEKFAEMCKGIPINLTLRHYYEFDKIIFVDRTGIINGNIKNINQQCYIPFYKLFIDWNGDFLLCDQDWGRYSKEFNIYNTTIKDFWCYKINNYRKNLILGNRSQQQPCNGCDVQGTLLGQESFDYISKRI